MEDKKVMEFINENHERAYNDFIKNQKRKNRIENFKIALFASAVLVLMIWLGVSVRLDTKKIIQNCLENGNDYNYCLYEANN